MRERIKMFTFVSGHGETLIEPPHQNHINEWLANARGKIIRVTQSESESRAGHHVTICVWYEPE